MLFGFELLFGYAFLVWLVFFKFRWLRFTIAWGVVSSLVIFHLGLIFLIGLRFVAPFSKDVKLIQHTIQLTPRLSEPTLVNAVLVKENVRVKKGTPLFRFDRTIYEYKVRQLRAQLAEARENVLVLNSDIQVAAANVVKLRSELIYAKYQQRLAVDLANKGAGPTEDVEKWNVQVITDEAGIKEAQAEEQRARLRYESEIGGVNTSVAAKRAELDQALFYLDNTTLVAPEDGYIINLQVRPGMVAGDYRMGAIASFICDSDRYLLATYYQENLKYVKPGQSIEAALDLYPGQIWNGKVVAIWQGSGNGQLLPSGVLPDWASPSPTPVPQGRFAAVIALDGPDQSKFPIGMQGRVAIYTNPGSPFSVLRRVDIRAYSWFNFLYPFSE
jgi:multidrug resistance efflux pump